VTHRQSSSPPPSAKLSINYSPSVIFRQRQGKGLTI